MIPRFALLSLIIATLVACGQDTAPEPGGDRPHVHRDSEMVPLRVRRLERPDRIQLTAREGTTLEAKREHSAVGWESERVGEQVAKVLKEWLSGDEIAAGENVAAPNLVPRELHLAGSLASGVGIWRPGGGDLVDNAAGLLGEVAERRAAKVVRIVLAPDHVEAVALIEVAGGGREATLTCRCRFRRTGGGDLVLVELERLAYEEVRSGDGPMFEDVTPGILGSEPHLATQVGRGIASWCGEISRFGDLALTGHHGIAVGDVDGDGREDLFVPDGGSLPNRLYRQREDGTCEDISAAAGVDWYEDSRAALLVDLDNDGDQDLAVATIAMIAVAENDGTGKFTLRGGFPGAQYPFSMCAADYDLDGDLDLYTCIYGEGDQASGGRGFDTRSPVPFENAQNGGRNVLLENLGEFGFADVTDDVGLGEANTRWSFAAAWEDFDRDGDPDLYVANDFGRNCLYRNDAGGFVEVAAEFGVEDTAAGMSVSWGDYNRDGRADLYVGNMFSSAGGRVGGQGEFAPGRGEQAIADLRRMAQGNSLFAGGTGAFDEIEGAAGAAMGRWAWASGFVDIDNDGWQDLVVANGYLSGFADPEDW